MRVLFAVVPGLGHMFPTVPLAWALRAAGHEVLYATAGSGAEAVARAGLTTVDTAPGLDVGAVFRKGMGGNADVARKLREQGTATASSGGQTPDFVLATYSRISDLMADETLRVARDWRPDVVVYTATQGAGLLAAADRDVPAVEHGVNFLRQDGLAARYLPFLAETAARLGVPDRLRQVEAIHVAPEEFLVGTGTGWQTRYVPYNAGGVLPEWLWRPAERPRVLVTLGTVLPNVTGLDAVAPVLAAAAEVDAEFLLAFGDGVGVDALGPLPANARPVGWVPLYQALARCDTIVHHGGSGTTLTALVAGVPQLVLPHGADQFVNADVVAKHRLGVRCEPGEVDAETLTELLGSDRFHKAARAAADQVRALPTPAQLVPRLEVLAGRS